MNFVPGNRSKSSCLKIKWHVEQVRVPSQAPKPSKSILLLTTTSSNESPIFPDALIFVPSAFTKHTSTLWSFRMKEIFFIALIEMWSRYSSKLRQFSVNTHSSFCRFGTFVEKLLTFERKSCFWASAINGWAFIIRFIALLLHFRMVCGLANVYAARTKVFRNIISIYCRWTQLFIHN